jgi:hypothetical protein
VTATALRAAVEDALESAHASRWQVTRSERDALELVEHICRRFPRYVWQLSERHAGRSALVIDDEYDVQDHLHALLRLHFDDVREEEWAPSYGGSRTRMDFLLKRERMVVETKMTRDRLDQAKVVDELVIDKAHYRQHPDCKTLVCFVYDPDHRLAQPRRARERRQRKRERLDYACDRCAPAELIETKRRHGRGLPDLKAP